MRDPAEQVALVAAAKRPVLLHVHRHRLRREDLEDAYSQATLELIVLARGGRRYASRSHVAHTIEQRFLARVQDRRRAVSGRSPIATALEGALPLVSEGVEPVDASGDPSRIALARDELLRVMRHMGALSADQRSVIETQLVFAMRCEEYCRLTGWTPEKYRKVAQRGRARLRELLACEGAPRRQKNEMACPISRPTSEQPAGTYL